MSMPADALHQTCPLARLALALGQLRDAANVIVYNMSKNRSNMAPCVRQLQRPRSSGDFSQ